jgi:hypothetical protein
MSTPSWIGSVIVNPAPRDDRQLQRIYENMQLARYYLDQAKISMRIANEEAEKWIAKTGSDMTLDQNPMWKGAAADNRWYMEWARVYDGQAQMEMKAYELGMY